MVVSADIDGVVSAAMLASVAPGWEIVGFVSQSTRLVLHPSVEAAMPPDLVAVDLFSPDFDSLSNHVVKYGTKKPKRLAVREAWREWDRVVDEAGQSRMHLVPSIWAATQAAYEDANNPRSAKYKYPLGTAQFLLAMLEAAGAPPKFYDRHYLPWLVANCDGGVSTYTRYGFNARVWWPVLAGAVGPASLTEQVFRMVDGMRPHDFMDTVNALDRERQAAGEERWLNDEWNLIDHKVPTLRRTLRWLADLTGWRDPVRGSLGNLDSWVERRVSGSGIVSLESISDADEDAAVASIRGAATALNANFYHGGHSGSRFNWAGGW